MKIYKNISVFKKDNVQGSQPTHDVVASEANFENKVTVASLWTKDGAKGKFLSGQMKNEYKSEKGTYPAYVIVQEDELQKLLDEVAKKDFRTSPSEDYPEGIDLMTHEFVTDAEKEELKRQQQLLDQASQSPF